MDQQGLKYRQQGNCFVWIEDYEEVQKLMNRQLAMNWAGLLNGLAGQLNPVHESIFEPYPVSYYRTCHQSEWATDIVFREADFLKRLMPLLVRHGMLDFLSPDVMRYFGRRVNQSEDVPANFIEVCIKNATINAKRGEGRIGGCILVVSPATFESDPWSG
jgi:hypothetical protein